MATELKVIADCYGLIAYLAERVEKFPRQYRYSLGVAMEQRAEEILALLIEAKYASKPDLKTTLLTSANVKLEVLRFQARLAHDRKALATKSHGHALKLMEQVGVQVGGWLRSRSGTAASSTAESRQRPPS